jgi:HlyD family secretion protein
VEFIPIIDRKDIIMATTTLPRRKTLSGRWIAVGIVLIVAAVLGALFINGRGQSANATGQSTVQVTRGNLTAAVAGSGSVAAEQTVNLAFQTGGKVTEVFVKEGDVVQARQALARLDDRVLQLQVTNARSALESAQARFAQAQQGNAKPEDIAAAEAQVASAQATYDKVSKGPTAADLASAQAAVSSGQAAYSAAVKSAGTSNSQLESAAATLQKAEASLRQAQANYDRVAGNPDIARRPESLSLQTATIDYQQAKANYESLTQTTSTDAQSTVASAAAQLALAKANLAKLTPAAEDLTVAKASLDQAKANLARLTAKATETDLQIQQAAVTQAEQSLKQAQLNLDNATLTAPFAGIVAQINIVPGSGADIATPALKLINRDPLHVDLKLSENDVAQVQLGQPIRLTIQSLGGWATDGKVSYIAPAADTNNGVVTYAVRVSFPDNDPKVKVGMTADLSIVTAQKENVLLVPNTALLPKGTGRVVQVPATDAQGRPATPREVEVKTGLTDGTMTEILSGLSEGQQVIALPDNGAARRAPGGFFGG